MNQDEFVTVFNIWMKEGDHSRVIVDDDGNIMYDHRDSGDLIAVSPSEVSDGNH